MKLILGVAAAVVALGMAAPANAGLGEAAELEHARANARAGGPLSYRDAELLERWGCLSGTENSFCAKLESRDRHYHKRYRKNHHR